MVMKRVGMDSKDDEDVSVPRSAVAMIGANLRFGSSSANVTSNVTKVFQCHPGGTAEAALIFALGTMGMAANVALMAVILSNKQLRR
ncbi:hypothetical protein GWI33_015639 [Rhynchophorus ferrugineus]|uniref:Uncharacterized protein n=1 Tax=Rhynchophorus ferrugineus TaxID=354439 RepID=A0A834MB76_RHYFE|nr:hypothetical protein GWI33_015639 [Rhynchophorus ferrugineus]